MWWNSVYIWSLRLVSIDTPIQNVDVANGLAGEFNLIHIGLLGRPKPWVLFIMYTIKQFINAYLEFKKNSSKYT